MTGIAGAEEIEDGGRVEMHYTVIFNVLYPSRQPGLDLGPSSPGSRN